MWRLGEGEGASYEMLEMDQVSVLGRILEHGGNTRREKAILVASRSER